MREEEYTQVRILVYRHCEVRNLLVDETKEVREDSIEVLRVDLVVLRLLVGQEHLRQRLAHEALDLWPRHWAEVVDCEHILAKDIRRRVEYFNLLNQRIVDDDYAEARCSCLTDSQLLNDFLVSLNLEKGLDVVQDKIEEGLLECAKINLLYVLGNQALIVDILLLLLSVLKVPVYSTDPIHCYGHFRTSNR